MKRILTAVATSLLVVGHCWSAPIDLVDVGAPEINCAFSPNCRLLVSQVFNPFILPGTTGFGILETRVYSGETGSAGPGIYGYEYRVDLTGVTAPIRRR